MRILFFIEPVIYWRDPSRYATHLTWVRQIEWAIGADDALGLASNLEICRAWEASPLRKTRYLSFPMDSYEPLAPFDWRRDKYSAALYGSGRGHNLLVSELRAIKKNFAPDLAISTTQNAFFDRVFADTPRLYLEQAPLPRYKQPFRTVFDPSGHQVGSMLEKRAKAIRTLLLPKAEIGEASQLLDELPEMLKGADERSRNACEYLKELRSEGPIALLVTQPPDWTTYEGAYLPIDIEGLLCDWEARLPKGWIGVPTFHEYSLLPPSVQDALARSRKRLRFLPPELSLATTEPLLTVADAMVTISSTSCAAGLLLGKPIVVVGRSPFRVWGLTKISELNKPICWDRSTTIRLLAFLTHRYARTEHQLCQNPAWIRGLLEERLKSSSCGDWQLDIAEWKAADAWAHFEVAT